MRIGLIRCMQTEDMCPGTRCFSAMREKTDAFAGVEEDIVLVGVSTCGGCPGKKAGLRAAMLRARGATAIAIASCIGKGTPIDCACPFATRLIRLVRESVGEEVPVIPYTHEPSKKKSSGIVELARPEGKG